MAAVEFFDPATRRLKPGAWDLFGLRVARVRPGVLDTRARVLPQSALSKELLPTLERPTKVTSATQGPSRCGSVSLMRY